MGQKFNVNVIKAAHRRLNLYSQKIFTGIGLRLKFPKNIIWKILCIFIKNLVNVATRLEEAFYNIAMFLYNKNILEFA